MLELAKRCEKSFRLFSEKWIRNKNGTLTDAQLQEINAILAETNDLAYSPTSPPAPAFSSMLNSGFKTDNTGALFVGIFGNLCPRLVKATMDGSDKAVALYAADLMQQSRDAQSSDLWNIIEKHPVELFRDIGDRLMNVSVILHELASSDRTIKIHDLHSTAKKARHNKGVLTAARRCRQAGETRLSGKLSSLINALKDERIEAECYQVPNEKLDAPYWPNVKILVAVKMGSIEEEHTHIVNTLELSKAHFDADWPFCVVPQINGKMITASALQIINGQHFPVIDFKEKWGKAVPTALPKAHASTTFLRAVTACTSLSGIVNCVDFTSLHPDEIDMFNFLLDEFLEAEREFIQFADSTNNEIAKECCDYLVDLRNRFIDEREAAEDGKPIDTPICDDAHKAMNGQTVEANDYLGTLTVLLAEAEANL